MTRTTITDRPTRAVRFSLPAHVHSELRHLGIDLGLGLDDLMMEAITLLLRHHDRGGGLPEPMAPLEGASR